MTNELPALRVLENNLPASHPGSRFVAGAKLPALAGEEDREPELASLYTPLKTGAEDGPLVRANFITTLDGSVMGADGKSGSINGPADLRVFQILRSQADAVLVGAGTARIEGYQDTDLPAGLQKKRKKTPPRLITVTRSGNLNPEFLSARPLVITAAGHRAATVLQGKVPPEDLLVFGTQSVDLVAALTELNRRGYGNILCEGGPHLFGALLEAGLVSEICLSFSPMIVGGSGYRVAISNLVPTRADLLILLSAADGFLMSRWSLRQPNYDQP